VARDQVHPPGHVDSGHRRSGLRGIAGGGEGGIALTKSDTAGEAARIQLTKRREATDSNARSLRATRELRDTPPPFPFGWFTVAFTRELRNGQVLTRRFMDREIVLFRTKSGIACAIEAYCPHLGAHLGHGGKVHGEELRCPFHGFGFSASGSCVHSPFGAPPPAARLELLPLREICGVVFVWHGPPGQKPWEIEFPHKELVWHRLWHWTVRIRSHPQEMAENGVDLGHFTALHGFNNVRVIEPFTVDGPRFRVGYAYTQNPFGISGPDVEFRILWDGLGFSRLETDIAGGRGVLVLGLATPVGEREMVVHLGVTLRRHSDSAIRKALWSCVDAVVGPLVLFEMVRQYKQDTRVWNRKKYLRRPAIAAGDGPIPAFRQWASQFYPEDADC